MNNKHGFTLVEILLSIALIAIVFAFSVPVLQSFQLRSDVDSAASLTVRALRTAQTLSQSGESDSAWSIHFASGLVTVFKGNSFSTRDTTLDIEYPMPTTVAFSGINDVTFSKLKGEPSATGNISLSSNNKSVQINLNAKGRVSY